MILLATRLFGGDLLVILRIPQHPMAENLVHEIEVELVQEDSP